MVSSMRKQNQHAINPRVSDFNNSLEAQASTSLLQLLRPNNLRGSKRHGKAQKTIKSYGHEIRRLYDTLNVYFAWLIATIRAVNLAQAVSLGILCNL